MDIEELISESMNAESNNVIVQFGNRWFEIQRFEDDEMADQFIIHIGPAEQDEI